MGSELTITTLLAPGNAHPVAEIWAGEDLAAIVDREGGVVRIRCFTVPGQLALDHYLISIENARRIVSGS